MHGRSTERAESSEHWKITVIERDEPNAGIFAIISYGAFQFVEVSEQLSERRVLNSFTNMSMGSVVKLRVEF